MVIKEEPTLYDRYGHKITLLLLGFEIGFMFALLIIYQIPKT